MQTYTPTTPHTNEQATRTDAPVPQSARKPGTPLAVTLLWLAVTTVVAIGSLEFIFYLAGVGEEEYLERHPVRGFVPVPSRQLTWRKEGYSRETFNSLGMRDRERTMAKPPDTFRVAILGDSMVESVQVPLEQSFCALTEAKLNREIESTGLAEGKKIEILNFGVSAYNLGQVYLAMQDVMKFQPDVILTTLRVSTTYSLAFVSPDNFFWARAGYKPDEGKFDYSVQDHWEKSSQGQRVKYTAWLRNHSRVWGIISKGFEQLIIWKKTFATSKNNGVSTSNRTAFDSIIEANQLHGVILPTRDKSAEGPPVVCRQYPPSIQKEEEAIAQLWPISEALLRKMQAECRQKNVVFGILRLPDRGHLENMSERTRLFALTEELKIPVLDLPNLRDKNGNEERYYYSVHFSPEGHRVVTEHLANFIKRFTR